MLPTPPAPDQPFEGPADRETRGNAPKPFSRLLTVVCSIAVAVYVFALPLGVPLVTGPSAHLDQLKRPAESLERLVAREMDLRAAMSRAAGWEWRLYTALSGSEDPLEEVQGWYQELVEADDSPSAELDRVILLAESGHLDRVERALADSAASGEPGHRMARWVTAAYLGTVPDLPAGRAIIAEIKTERPADWFADTLVARVAARVGDAPAVSAAEAAIAARGRTLLLRLRVLTILGGGLLAAGALALVAALARRSGVRVAMAPMPPAWTAADGYALFVRGLGAPQVLSLVLYVLIRRETSVGTALAMAIDLPLFWWIVRYHAARGTSAWETFGLTARPGGAGPLVGVALILIALALAGDAAIDAGGALFGWKSHWADGFFEDLLWAPRWSFLLGAFDVIVWAPVVEELTFRGLLYGTLRTRLSVWPAALLSAALFALPHGYGLLGSVSVLWSGVLWALAYERTRSLLPGLLAHSANNLMSTLWVAAFLRA